MKSSVMEPGILASAARTNSRGVLGSASAARRAIEDCRQAGHGGSRVFAAGAGQGGQTLAVLFHDQDRPAGALHEPVTGTAQERPGAAVQERDVERSAGAIEVRRVQAVEQE